MDGITSMSTDTALAVITEKMNNAENIIQYCAEEYKVFSFSTIKELMQTDFDKQPELILCQQELLEEKENSHSLTALTKQFQQSKLLIFGPPRPISVQITALRQGARGYFNQILPLDKLNIALKSVLHGEVWVERQVIAGLLDELTHLPQIADEQKQALDTLSPKEMEVAKFVSHGATNKMIARSMNITERTVKAHLTAIFHKMSLPDRLSLAIFFRDLRL